MIDLPGGLAVQGQVVAPGLAFTPALGPDGFSGYWNLAHIPSGRTLTAYAVLDLDALKPVVEALAEAGHNWDVPMDQIPADATAAAAKAVREMYASELGQEQEEQEIQDHEAPFVLPAAVFDQPPPRD
jgi:hypothetical protein